jgi:hypothetical protein
MDTPHLCGALLYAALHAEANLRAGAGGADAVFFYFLILKTV